MNKKLIGAVLATAVACFLMSGQVKAAEEATEGATEAKVKCFGVNECKGKAACKSVKNACAGKNGCAGQGFIKLTDKECKDKEGSTTEPKA